MTEADTKLRNALAAAKIAAPDIIGELHSAYHDGSMLPARYTAMRIRDAREHAEKLLVAILAAEQALSPEVAA